MELLPIKTKVLQPPQDDLLAALDTTDLSLKERDIVVVSSKVVAIHEGRCLPKDAVDKAALIQQEADVVIPREYWKSPLTIIHSAFIGTAGIDESNADGHFILLPEDPMASAGRLHAHLKEKFNLKELGIIISDSHSVPLRRGALGISIGFRGFTPTISHVGDEDLFGCELQIEVTNLVDGIAAAANVVMGETNECQPVVIARGVPEVTFVDVDLKDDVYLKPEEDTFRVLYQDFLS